MYCVHCGNQIDPNQKFCIHCGKIVTDYQNEKKEQKEDIDLTCPKCHGMGSRRQKQSFFGFFKKEVDVKCEKCGGTGDFFRICPDCKGQGANEFGMPCSLCKGKRKISRNKAFDIEEGDDFVRKLAKNPVKSIAFILINFFIITPVMVFLGLELHFGAIALAPAFWYPPIIWKTRLELPLRLVLCIAIIIIYVIWILFLVGMMAPSDLSTAE